MWRQNQKMCIILLTRALGAGGLDEATALALTTMARRSGDPRHHNCLDHLVSDQEGEEVSAGPPCAAGYRTVRRGYNVAG